MTQLVRAPDRSSEDPGSNPGLFSSPFNSAKKKKKKKKKNIQSFLFNYQLVLQLGAPEYI